MTRTKVFVGNLSFKTKREDLASEFGAAGKVVEANIITRGTRSLGYGFVEMESEEDAQKAITIMNKKPIDSREINVELAKPRDESKVAEKRASSNQEGGDSGAGGAPNRRPRRRYRRGDSSGSTSSPSTGRNNNNNNNNEGGNNNNNRGGDRNNNAQRSGGKRASAAGGSGDREGGRDNSGGNGGGADGGDKAPGNRRFRNRRFRRARFPRKDLPQRKETETSLFVANLPFSIDNQGLSDLYKAYNVKSAHVVVNRNGKSKGFGFVELASQADQKAALDATNKSKVDGRELIVKIALTPIEEHKDSASSSSQPEASSNEPAKEEPKK